MESSGAAVAVHQSAERPTRRAVVLVGLHIGSTTGSCAHIQTRTNDGTLSNDTTPGSSFTFTAGSLSLSFPFPLLLSFEGRPRGRVELSATSGGVSSSCSEVARETIASSESRGRRAGSKSDSACDDEAVASGMMIGSEGVDTTARLRAEARWDLVLSALWAGGDGGQNKAIEVVVVPVRPRGTQTNQCERLCQNFCNQRTGRIRTLCPDEPVFFESHPCRWELRRWSPMQNEWYRSCPGRMWVGTSMSQ